jgi:transcriptional antiterminator Rof (Rho-off)
VEYQRISCNLFDRLENLALAKTKLKITFMNENQSPEEIEGIIQNIFSENKAEFLSVNNVKIRLDKIQSIINS